MQMKKNPRIESDIMFVVLVSLMPLNFVNAIETAVLREYTGEQ